MRVKVGSIWYDETNAIMVYLTDKDKENIANMLPEATRYASFPSYWTREEAEKWMDE